MKRKKSGRKSRSKRRKLSGDQAFSPAIVSGIKRKKKRSKRSRIGAIDSEAIKVIAGGIAGALAGYFAENLIPGNVSSKIKNAGILVAGAGTSVFGYNKKNMPLLAFGIGLSAGSAVSLAKDTGILKGMDSFIRGMGLGKEDSMLIEMNGVDLNSTKFISGDEQFNPDVISGYEDENGTKIMGTENPMPSVVS